MTVIDTSSFAKFLLREPGWEEVRTILTPASDLYGVGILITETTNVIWKHAAFFGDKEEDAWKRFQAMEMIFDGNVISVEPDRKYLEHAFRIAMDHKIPVYDSLFIAQAKNYETTLVTSDNNQAEIAGDLDIQVKVI